MHFDTASRKKILGILQRWFLTLPLHLAVLSLCYSFSLYAQSKTSVLFDAPVDIGRIDAPFEMPQLQRPVFPPRSYSIKDFGAKEGGLEKNTEAIQKAIEAASHDGGGTVIIPEGRWLTGAIHFENNINLFLSKNAELLFSQDVNDYLPAVFSRHEDTECYKFSSFIYAEGKTNIAITGEGILNGQGKPWWEWKGARKSSDQRLQEMADKNVPVRERIFDGTGGFALRPAFFQPMNCKNILVEGVTFLYGAFWTITPTYCENIIVRKVRITTEGAYGHTPNGDGVDPSSSKNILIEYCEFDTGDDCIAIKAGRDSDGLRVNKPTENIVVRHCTGFHGHGGVVVGSETSGGVRNIYAYDCHFNGTERIVRIKTARGRGGVLENMWFRELSADTITEQALHINMLYTGTRLPAEAVTNTTPRVRNIHFSNISCSYGKKAAIEILGIPEMPVKDITFDSIFIASAKGIVCNDARDVRFGNIRVHPSSGPIISILESENISFDRVDVPEGTETVVYADGSKTSNIVLTNTAVPKSQNGIRFGTSISHEAVVVH